MSESTTPSPWSALLGIAIPGAGHWLHGERNKAIAIFAIVHVVVIGAFLAGAAVAPPQPPEPLFTGGLSQSDPIGNLMRTMEKVAQGSGGVSVWATKFFGYSREFDGTFQNTYTTNLLNLAGVLNLLASFFLFDQKRQEAKTAAAQPAEKRRKEKKR